MSNKVIIKLKKPLHGPGVFQDRATIHEKVFTEEVFGENYKEVAREWSVTHVNNVAHIEGLDDASEKEISVARKKKEKTE